MSIGNIFYMRRDAREALVKQKLEYLTSYMETVSRAERESRRIRHDKRHHDACIAAMARAGDTDGILRYLEQEQAVAENFPAWCPRPMVNELLRSYAEKAKAAGVAFTAQADTPTQSDVADVDFVAILANLLENALNACTAAHSTGPRPHPKRREKDGPRGEQPLRQLEAGKRPARRAERRDRQHRFRRRALSG